MEGVEDQVDRVEVDQVARVVDQEEREVDKGKVVVVKVKVVVKMVRVKEKVVKRKGMENLVKERIMMEIIIKMLMK